jgi:hypothetical protein
MLTLLFQGGLIQIISQYQNLHHIINIYCVLKFFFTNPVQIIDHVFIRQIFFKFYPRHRKKIYARALVGICVKSH